MEVWVNHRNFAHLVHEPGYYGALTETDRIMKKNLYSNEIAIMKRFIKGDRFIFENNKRGQVRTVKQTELDFEWKLRHAYPQPDGSGSK